MGPIRAWGCPALSASPLQLSGSPERSELELSRSVQQIAGSVPGFLHQQFWGEAREFAFQTLPSVHPQAPDNGQSVCENRRCFGDCCRSTPKLRSFQAHSGGGVLGGYRRSANANQAGAGNSVGAQQGGKQHSLPRWVQAGWRGHVASVCVSFCFVFE